MNAILRLVGQRLGAKVDGPLGRLVDPDSAQPVDLCDALMPVFLRIRVRNGQLVPLRLNAAQRLFARQRGQRNIVLKARQLGITTYIAARLFLQTLLRPGMLALQVAHSLESAQQIFRIVHRFYSCLPARIQRVVITERSSVRELAFAEWDSRFRVETAGSPGAGRGLTVHNLHASEVALWPGNPAETMAGLLAAVPPHGNVDIESTPNGAGGYFFEEWQRAKSASAADRAKDPARFTPHFFPWWIEPAYRAELFPGESLEPLDERERELMAREGLTAEQIKFRRQLRAQFGGLAPQEYAENDAECFLLSGRPMFEVARVEERLRQVGSPVREEHNGELRVWLEPVPGRSYVIGADTAEGNEASDESVAVVIDAAGGLQCAEFAARSAPHDFARMLARLGRLYNGAVVAVERNNHGHAVLEALLHSFHYENIYAHETEAAGFGAGISTAVARATGSRMGWPTNAQTKPQAVMALDRMLRDAPEAIASRRLLEQCRSFVRLDGGASGAVAGARDDLVMAAAIAYAVREQSRPAQLLGAPLASRAPGA